jgi:hypothetical protein
MYVVATSKSIQLHRRDKENLYFVTEKIIKKILKNKMISKV